MTHSATGLNNAWAQAIKASDELYEGETQYRDINDNRVPSPEAEARAAADLARRRKEDFDFMVICQMKGNMSMYRLLRDRSLDNEK